MKYHTLGSESKSSSGFTLYADMGISDDKISYTESDMKKVREQLELVQKDLKLQTKRCRYLVAEYTRRLQEKEQLYRSERALRDTQLAKVLKALLIFEARLRQEQKLISHQLSEKDYTIKRLLANQYCRNCNQYYAGLDSSSEYVVTESSNMESLDSSSDTYGKSESDKNDEPPTEERKAYFEVLKMRNESSLSNDDNTSADYDNLDSLPPESISDRISVVSESIENMLNKTKNVTPNSSTSESSVNVTTSSSESCPKTVIDRTVEDATTMAENKLTEVIPVFESGTDTNDNWYASASDQEDDDQRNVYRNNPVLECMNQILLQNINDINSPPKTPNIERKNNKSNKRVKFSDEEQRRSPPEETHNYYETPIQNTPNFYETPQSIYSNDYEQILSKSSETSSDGAKPESTHYIEMEPSTGESANNNNNPIRKSKISRTPPALPPKPPNLVSKCKIQTLLKKSPNETASSSVDTEPDYCSISELNLPQNKTAAPKKISVVAEVHQETPKTKERTVTSEEKNVKLAEEDVPNMVVKKCVEKLNIQLAKNTTVPKKKIDVQIPKLPQVSEIIIPDDPEETDEEQQQLVSQDNYVKNKTQIMQGKKGGREPKGPIVIGSSVSSLISGFNNRQIIDEIKRKHDRKKTTTVFSSFENVQNADKHTFENFDLSQNFEEFKLDDCEIEEYDVEEELEKEEKQKDQIEGRDRSPTETTRVDYVRAKDMAQPRLSQASIDLLKKQLELQRSQMPNKPGTTDDANKSPGQATYEHFLECRGLSSKSLLTPARILTNHKHMLKPKDVKLRSKVKANNGNGFNGTTTTTTTTMRYWSEPFV